MADVLQAIQSIEDPDVAAKAKAAVAALQRTCLLYPLERIAFSFNGGKDSTVLLHLLRAAVTKLQAAEAGLGGIRSFYFVRKDDFPEVKEFVEASDKRYSLSVDYLTEPDFKKGLVQYLEQTGVMAIILGTRRGDPNAPGQDTFCPSSEGWPPFMRVNPILDWSYRDVWTFLRAADAPYCPLYDAGYTSLGGVGNTVRNSTLKREDGTYAPAYMLADGRLERAGRFVPKPITSAHHHAHHPQAQAQQPAQAPGPSGSAGGPAATADADSDAKEAAPGMVVEGGSAGGIMATRSGSLSLSRSASGAVPRHSSGGGMAGGALTRSAALLIIGDELLSGKVTDTNTPFLCRELRAMGWQVLRVLMIPDDRDTIAQAVRLVSQQFEVVLTSGGIGPTLDDVTMEGIAQGFGVPLVRHPELESKLRSYFAAAKPGEPLSEAHLKMAEAPAESQAIMYVGEDGLPTKFPLVRVHNVYVLPGVPHLLQRKWQAVKAELLKQAALLPFRNATIKLALSDETQVAPALVRVASAHGLDVQLGSYPVTEREDGAGIIITLDSKDGEKLAAAVEDMKALLPSESIVSVDSNVGVL